MVLGRRLNVGWVAVAFLGLCLLTLPWLADLRPPPVPDRAQREYRVSTGGDGGVGSLREAIVTANRAPGRSRIVLPPLTIKIETPYDQEIIRLNLQLNATIIRYGSKDEQENAAKNKSVLAALSSEIGRAHV